MDSELDRRLRYYIQQFGSQQKLEEFYDKSLEEFKNELREPLRLELLSQQLLEKTKILDSMVRTDFLTGLANRMHILEQLKREESRFKRGTPLCSIIIADIDNFKIINDRYGHETCDNVLKSVADVFRNNTRKQDVVARWGGEEFLFMLPETSGKSAYKAAEKIRVAVAETVIPDREGDLHITMTFGTCEFDVDLSVDGTIRMADNALYRGKINGKNCVEIDNNARE